MRPLPASLYPGDVGHMRHGPKRHRLRYGMVCVLADIDGPARDDSASPLFSFDRFNLVSVHARDHGDGRDLRAWCSERLREAGQDTPLGRIQLLAAPRILGIVFNPVSVFFCHDSEDRLAGMIFEVSNFHGGRCAYAFPVEPGADLPLRFSCPKRFFVSPFNPVEGEYRFRLERDADRYRLGIQLFRDGQCVMGAVHTAKRDTLTHSALLRAQFRQPFNTVTILGGILFEALRLRLKGLTTFSPRRGTVDTLPRRT